MLHNKESWDNFVSFTIRTRKRRLDDGNEDSSIAHTILLPGWIMRRPMFHLSKQGGEWLTFLGKSTFTNQVVYPNFVSNIPTFSQSWREMYIYEVTKLIFAFCLTLYTPFRDPRIFECNLASTELAPTNGRDGKLGHTHPLSLSCWHREYW
jgi:hypothetical protein